MSDEHPTETWQPVPGFPDYQVSDLGRVRSCRPVNGRGPRLDHWRIVGGNLSNRGYHRTALSKGSGRQKTVFVHTLVLAAFHGPRPPGKQCCHNDGDKDNNRADNLRYGTEADNAADRLKHGHQLCGETHGSATLSTDQIREIRWCRALRISPSVIAARFGISRTHVTRIAQSMAWKCLATEPLPRYSREKLVEAIRLSGRVPAHVAEEAGIHQSHLVKIQQGKKRPSWEVLKRLATALQIDPLSLHDIR